MSVFDFAPCTFVTTTSYGTWLPGDTRGYVQRGEILPPEPKLVRHATSLLRQPPVHFSEAEQDVLFQALMHACQEFDYRLSDVTIESWHAHWIIAHDDAPKQMVGRLKNRMRQALARGRIWTKGYCHRSMTRLAELEDARAYIAKHAGCRLTDGRCREPSS